MLFVPSRNQVQFNPTQPHLLYASQRRSDDILCWDTRNPTDPYAVIRTVKRNARQTNQKLRFDVDPFGKWLVAGDQVSFLFVVLMIIAVYGS